MTKLDYIYYVKWIHMLAWRTQETCELSHEERKAIGVFIGNVKRGTYISEENTLLARMVKIIDAHSPIKAAHMPEMQEEYTKEERMAINKGIRELHKALDESSRVWGYCQQYLFCKSGKRNTRVPSGNKLNLAKMTLAVHANQDSPITYATAKQRSSNSETTTRIG